MRSAGIGLLLLASIIALPEASVGMPAGPGPKVDTIPVARDIAFPGTMLLTVDATDIERRIFRVHQTIPVPEAGKMTLLYPKWLPGKHLPAGEIEKVAGLRVSAGGRNLPWRRDTLDAYAFHIDVPEGAKTIDVEFQFLSATAENQGRIVMTADMASIQWIAQSLYPAGYYVRNIPIQATVKLPPGWKAATALRPVRGADTATITYETVSYDVLADSPLIAGMHFRRIPLGENVTMAIAADTAEELAANDVQIAAHRALVRQAALLFGAHHFDRYEFLVTISGNLGDIGLEHHRSSENGLETGYFTDWANVLRDRNTLPHEYVHSWNGKYRRGNDLWTPDYRTPMEDSLLWVYEGQTQFWGYVLGARSGMLSRDDTLSAIAAFAATYANRPGRAWRPLLDTTNDPIIARRAPQAWRSWQRSEDYYSEAMLMWFDVDRIIRQQSRGRRSLDDFARAFFGMNDGAFDELTYTRDDVLATLNQVQPFDWKGYFGRHVDSIADPPLEGITEGGYRLVYTEEPTAWFKAEEKRRQSVDLTYSGGLNLSSDGRINAVLWDSAAFDAGLTVGTKLIAINGRTYSSDALKAALRNAKGKRTPIRLIVQSGDVVRTADLAWFEGLRYPRLERSSKGGSTLDALLAPR